MRKERADKPLSAMKFQFGQNVGQGRQVTIEVRIESGAWDAATFEAQSVAACTQTLRYLGINPDLCEVSVLGCDDLRIAALNTDFRGKPQATNVLSWPAYDLAAEIDGAQPHPPAPDFSGAIELGDIAIAFETCQREAEAAQKTLSDHVTHLIVHGTLHLLGYDHIRDLDATLMQGIEIEILGNMGLDDPYRE